MTRLTGFILNASAEVTITVSANLNLEQMGGAAPVALTPKAPLDRTLGPGVFRVVSGDKDVVTVTAAPGGKYIHITQRIKDGPVPDPPKVAQEQFGAAAIQAYFQLAGGQM
jgi:hypothetical protein